MKDYFEIFCSNDEGEITQVKAAFKEKGIKYNFSINNTENIIFGISPLSNTRDLSYKYQIQVCESDLDNAEKIIKELLVLTNQIENELPDPSENEPKYDQIIKKNEIPNIARSVLLLLVFCHFTRFFDFVSQNIKDKKNKNILILFGVFLLLTLVILNSIMYIQWFGLIIGLLSSIIIIAIFQFFINLIDYLITRNIVQGYSWLILLGLIIILIVGIKVLARIS